VDSYRIPDARALRRTARALLVEFDRGTEKWVPLSQIAADSRVWYPGDFGTLRVTRWWASRAGLLDETDADQSAGSTPSPPIDLSNARRIYRALAQRHHPDRNPGGAATMTALNELWQAVAADLGVRL
jgi:hypothetical protein